MKELNVHYIAGLVLRAQSSDSDAFAELYAMTYNKVYNYTRHYLRDDDLAQDALQEVFILALRNLNKLNDPTLFIAWLNRICFNVCYDMSNKAKVTSDQISDPDTMELVPDDGPGNNPETHYQTKDEKQRLNQALNSLPFHEKQALVMRYYNNMKLEEIATVMEISRSSVKRYIASGQDKLRTLMKE